MNKQKKLQSIARVKRQVKSLGRLAMTYVSALLLLVLTMTFIDSSSAEAKTKKKKHQRPSQTLTAPKAKATSATGRAVSRDVVFDGSTVNGRYHSAGEAVTTVETEKKMNELVGFRRDFKDRLNEESLRLKSGAPVESSVR